MTTNTSTRVSRVRHELKRRTLTVTAVERLTPRMQRVVLGGEDLADFVSLGYDDHVKLLFGAAPSEGGPPPMRDFTPRAYDTETRSLTVDFALHDAGVADVWAQGVAVGDLLNVGGPKGSMIVAPDFDWYLLVGDESALPAIARRLEELPPHAVALVVIAVAGPQEEQVLAAPANTTLRWVHRPLAAGDDPAPILDALATLDLPTGEGYCWVAAEHTVAKAVRAHLIERPQVSTDWLKAAAYWRKGEADAHEKLA